MYQAKETRYETMQYERCGKSGLRLPKISLGLWQNFGEETPIGLQKEKLFQAFDLGITHFDLANNYGFPAIGAAEENFGRILKSDLMPYRDEMIISTKAGYEMWNGPYGDGGSRKYLMASLDQSLSRMGLDYVDIYYHHRPDYETPLEETMEALSDIVRQGKALYVGISNYKPEETKRAIEILKENKTPCLIHQVRYNMLEREPEKELFPVLKENGVGCICFCPLAQGVLTNKYLKEVPEGSRAYQNDWFKDYLLTEKNLSKVRRLDEIAKTRGQSMAQMALAWNLSHDAVTSVLIGASRVSQIIDNVHILDNLSFSDDELSLINKILEE
ncbi:putative ion-channel protein [Lachnospiraceae bacterium KM106-2]|nr:putative ion-channel protein [Lachnospiraceae bacterium KM106-2]